MPEAVARELVELLAASGRTVATAESLTGGLLGAAVTDVPGSSRVFRGGVVAYATDLKHQLLLGVDADLLARVGAVDPRVAAAMAAGVRSRLGADVGLATTGVAGPDPQDGHAPGTVWLGLADADGAWAVGAGHDVAAAVADGRAAVRRVTVEAVLACAVRYLRDGERGEDGGPHGR